MLSVCEEDVSAPVSMVLRSALSRELAERYDNAEAGAAGFDPAKVGDGGAFVVARLHGQPVGCGAIVPLDPETAEVKRVFVLPDRRGEGIAKAVMSRLEGLARSRGYRSLRLETGDRQAEAVALYEQIGYRHVDCWGPYVGRSYSVCMEKQLG